MSRDSDEYDNYPSSVVMPTVWKGKDGTAIRSNTPVVHPDDMGKAERDMLTTTYNTCGQCQYFEKAEGQHQMTAQRFLERLVREEDWRAHHLASQPGEMGLCGAHSSGRGGDQMLTGPLCKACSQFRPNKGLVSIRRKST
jgi:hypothetical protein